MLEWIIYFDQFCTSYDTIYVTFFNETSFTRNAVERFHKDGRRESNWTHRLSISHSYNLLSIMYVAQFHFVGTHDY